MKAPNDITRRNLIKGAAIAGAAILLPIPATGGARPAEDGRDVILIRGTGSLVTYDKPGAIAPTFTKEGILAMLGPDIARTVTIGEIRSGSKAPAERYNMGFRTPPRGRRS